MKQEERDEALQAIAKHYGMGVLLEEVDRIVDRIARGVMSAPLDRDPQKASLTLYAERMKTEGAQAVKIALLEKVKALRSGEK